MSHSDPLTYGDARCLTRCHPISVSNSCHFFTPGSALNERAVEGRTNWHLQFSTRSTTIELLSYSLTRVLFCAAERGHT
jgi:hypothetical protein